MFISCISFFLFLKNPEVSSVLYLTYITLVSFLIFFFLSLLFIPFTILLLFSFLAPKLSSFSSLLPPTIITFLLPLHSFLPHHYFPLPLPSTAIFLFDNTPSLTFCDLAWKAGGSQSRDWQWASKRSTAVMMMMERKLKYFQHDLWQRRR